MNPVVLQPVFDADWYRNAYPDVAAVAADPWEHFVRFGAAEGRAPGPWFDGSWYLQRYPDVAASDFDALEHYLTFGLSEGRHPNRAWEVLTPRDAQDGEALTWVATDLAGLGSLIAQSKRYGILDQLLGPRDLEMLTWLDLDLLATIAAARS